jgi:hypothetical protein
MIHADQSADPLRYGVGLSARRKARGRVSGAAISPGGTEAS